MTESVKKVSHPKTRRRAAAGLAGLLIGAAAPLVIAPTASAVTCDIVADPSKDHHTVCQNKDLRDQDFNFKDLRYADLSGSNLSGMHLIKVKLGYAKLDGANLSNVEFERTSINFGSLKNATLSGAKLTNESTITGADVSGTDMMPPRRFPSPATTQMLMQAARPIVGTQIHDCFEVTRIPRVQFGAGGPYTIKCIFSAGGTVVAAGGTMQLFVGPATG
ncbi:pentapeptide repeat-containing protein [Mycobacterium haemophilum]